jgi:hydrolase, NUDIX family
MSEKRNTVPITALLMLKKANKILLLKRINTGYEDGKFCFPGGHVEKGEPIHEAMIREAKEEIGVDINKNDLKLVHICNRKVKDDAYVDFIFECLKWKGKEKVAEYDKASEIQWIDEKDIPDNIIPFMDEVFKNKDKLYIPYGWEG